MQLDRCTYQIRGSIVVSISACHAEDPGSIPGRGDPTAGDVSELKQDSAVLLHIGFDFEQHSIMKQICFPCF